MSGFVRLFIVLVTVNAVVGSAVLLVGGLGGTGGKVFVTSLLTTAAVLVGIACSTGWRQPRLRVVGVAGVAATAAGFAIADLGIWWQVSADWYGKLTGTLILAGVSAATVSLLGLVTLPPRHRWIFDSAGAVAAGVTAMAVIAIWTSLGTGWYLRVLGVLAVAFATLVLIIPALHRAAEHEMQVAAKPTDHLGFCPVCGRPMDAAAGVEVACGACGSRFVVHLSRHAVRAVDELRDERVADQPCSSPTRAAGLSEHQTSGLASGS
jgi:hypothetical protein